MGHCSTRDLHEVAVKCVQAMGNVFRESQPEPDRMGEYSNPRAVAIQAIENTLRCTTMNGESLFDEYTGIIGGEADTEDEGAIIDILTKQAAWTNDGARIVLDLAQRYGSSVLQNALAIATVLAIEDGSDGL